MTASLEKKLAEKRKQYKSQGLSDKEINSRLQQIRVSTVTKPKGAKNATGKALGKKIYRESGSNGYLAALVDPEHHPPTGVPDEFGRLVHRCSIITQHKAVFKDGASSAIVRPTLQNLLQATTDQGTAEYFTRTFSVISGSKLVQNGRRPDYYDTSVPTDYTLRNRKMIATEGSSYLIWSPPENDEGDPSPLSVQIINGFATKCVPIEGTSGGNVTVSGDMVNTSGLGVTPYCKVWDGTSVTKITAFTFTNTGPFTIALPFGATQTHLFEYGIEVTGGAGVVELESIYTSILVTLPVDPGTMNSYNIGTTNDYELLKASGRTFRISALSAWVIYNGAMTSNGQLASAFVETRDDPQSTGLVTYANLSMIPNSYVGPLNKGSYTFWEPIGIEDLKFHEINYFDETMPFIGIAMTANDAAAQEVTIRICAHVELQTTNQVLGPRPSIIEPNLIIEAFKAVRGITNSMENDSHLRKIADIIQKGLNVAGDVSGIASAVAAMMGQPELAVPLGAISVGSLQSANLMNRY